MFSYSPISATVTSPGSPWFYCGAPQDEALARLHFLVDEHRSFGLLIGAPGVGKSGVLTRFAHELSRAGGEAVLLDLLGRDSREMLWAIASGLHARVDAQAAPFALWRAISDRLLENSLLHVPTAILCDHVDQANDDALAMIARLVHGSDHGGHGPTIIATTTADAAGQLPRRLIDRIDLRVDLDPWSEEDVAGYLDARRAAAGPQAPRVDRPAAHRMWELSRGLPRSVVRLTDLALVVSLGQRLTLVNPQTIDTVHQELSAVA